MGTALAMHWSLLNRPIHCTISCLSCKWPFNHSQDRSILRTNSFQMSGEMQIASCIKEYGTVLLSLLERFGVVGLAPAVICIEFVLYQCSRELSKSAKNEEF